MKTTSREKTVDLEDITQVDGVDGVNGVNGVNGTGQDAKNHRQPRQRREATEGGGGGGGVGDVGLQAVTAVLRPATLSTLRPGTYVFADVSDLSLLQEHNHREIDEEGEDFERLRNSIAFGGVKEPVQLFLETLPDGTRAVKIVAGHHRTRAVSVLRSHGNQVRLPARLDVPEAGETEEKAALASRFMTAAVTNLVKKDLRGLERARAIKGLVDSGMKIGEISAALGYDRKIIERSLNILTLPQEATEFIAANISRLRESRLAAIAQAYKTAVRTAEAANGDSAGDGDKEREKTRLATLAAASREALASLEEERGRHTAATAAGPSPGHRSRPRGSPRRSVRLLDGQRAIDVKSFEARLTLAKIPAATLMAVMEALEAAAVD